ncbi:hypothetical protein F5B22DRAFT_432128 [Xylaria bambusicola]|uniref:uncharacterized protein n=1 Tax=Xylaria bambusicola TaxID=326684 RepID=UPI00200760ED|nr:uncharacterized protein F5B22DRAFT_432128 [Xylaria bambusicola]KAI0506824.1 hypothetical protein F5B22DRAFT_432128 [Xylaria bambusicola]
MHACMHVLVCLGTPERAAPATPHTFAPAATPDHRRSRVTCCRCVLLRKYITLPSNVGERGSLSLSLSVCLSLSEITDNYRTIVYVHIQCNVHTVHIKYANPPKPHIYFGIQIRRQLYGRYRPSFLSVLPSSADGKKTKKVVFEKSTIPPSLSMLHQPMKHTA